MPLGRLQGRQIAKMHSLLLARRFSRTGLPLLRLAQEEAGAAAAETSPSSWIYRGAILIAAMGMGVSAFSMNRLTGTVRCKK